MPRFVEIRDLRELPTKVSLIAGDVLWIWAGGGAGREEDVNRTGGVPLQIVGPLITGVIGSNGAIISPAGLPNVVLIVAILPGEMDVDLFDPLQPGRKVSVHISVAASAKT